MKPFIGQIQLFPYNVEGNTWSVQTESCLTSTIIPLCSWSWATGTVATVIPPLHCLTSGEKDSSPTPNTTSPWMESLRKG